MKVQRIIHPIGQGAFYTEQFTSNGDTFTIVYDCGCEMIHNIPTDAEEVVSEWVQQVNHIDILFISHFHNDHLNGIKKLMSKTKVVVLPYITRSLVNELNRLQTNLSGSGIELGFDIPTPKKYPTVKFVFMISNKNNKQNLYPILNQPKPVQTPGDFNANSGHFVDVFNNHNYITGSNIAYMESGNMIDIFQWYFKPFTPEVDSNDFSMLESITNLNKYIENLDHENWYIDAEILKHVRSLYKAINKDLNNTSMFLFSAPMSLSKCNDTSESHSPSCLYTGDIKLTLGNYSLISKHLGNYNIGTFQVPHHGSSRNWKNFNTKMPIPNTTNDTVYFCSHGLHTGYNHPHKAVLADFKKAGKLLWGINDNPSTILEQNFTV